jgi:hypothetical protein
MMDVGQRGAGRGLVPAVGALVVLQNGRLVPGDAGGRGLVLVVAAEGMAELVQHDSTDLVVVAVVI